MSDDLVKFVRARLDHDEQVAREATAGPWRNAPTPRHHATATGRSEEAVFAAPPGRGATVVASTGEAQERQNLVDAEHIARHNPARVLADIEAKRQIVKVHFRRRSYDWDEPGVKGFECAQCCDRYPCRTLRLLALPYADHPEYREEWRP